MEANKLLPLSGIAFVAVVAVAVALSLGTGVPDGNTAPGDIASYYDEHWLLQFVLSFALAAAAPLLVLFAAGIAAARAGADGRRVVWERLLLGGSVLTGTVLLGIALVNLALVDGARNGASGGALETLNLLNGSVWIAQSAALGTLMLGAAGTFLSAPRAAALGWSALVLGIALFIPVADFFAVLLTGVWIVAAALVCTWSASVRYRVAHESA